MMDSHNKLKVNLSDGFLIDNSGKINLKISNDLAYDNYYLSLNLNPTYLKFDSDGKLNLDTTNLNHTAGTGINLVNKIISAKVNSNRGISVDQNGIRLKIDFTQLQNLDTEILKIDGKLFIDFTNLNSHLIKLNYNSAITRDFNRFYDVKRDEITISTDTTNGKLKIKDGYIQSIINNSYIQEAVQSSSWFTQKLLDSWYFSWSKAWIPDHCTSHICLYDLSTKNIDYNHTLKNNINVANERNWLFSYLTDGDDVNRSVLLNQDSVFSTYTIFNYCRIS